MMRILKNSVRNGWQFWLLVGLTWLLTATAALAQQVEYRVEDSVLVVRLLSEASERPVDLPRTLWFGQQLEGCPYVAHTLEEGRNEHLIVNLRGLDCTTFVETVCALSLCDARNERSFADFCHWLRQLRYRDGRIGDYTSRLHYFVQWADDNERMGLVTDVLSETEDAGLATQVVDISYMSQHPDLYKHLRANPQLVPVIRQQERAEQGKRLRYVPKSRLAESSQRLNYIHSGDILALVTRKAGLDTTHLGLAVWKNGRLHLMHASNLKKRVLIDPTTLFDYSQGQRSQLGIRVVRLKTDVNL